MRAKGVSKIGEAEVARREVELLVAAGLRAAARASMKGMLDLRYLPITRPSGPSTAAALK